MNANDITRVRNCFRRENIDIENKEQLISFLTKYAMETSCAFTTRSFGLAASLTTQSLYPEDLVVIGNGITSIEGKKIIDEMNEERRKLLQRNKNDRTFTVTISRDLYKTILEMKKELRKKYNMIIPMNVALQEMIRSWGEMHERKE